MNYFRNVPQTLCIFYTNYIKLTHNTEVISVIWSTGIFYLQQNVNPESTEIYAPFLCYIFAVYSILTLFL
jgi:hypothetical protein